MKIFSSCICLVLLSFSTVFIANAALDNDSDDSFDPRRMGYGMGRSEAQDLSTLIGQLKVLEADLVTAKKNLNNDKEIRAIQIQIDLVERRLGIGSLNYGSPIASGISGGKVDSSWGSGPNALVSAILFQMASPVGEKIKVGSRGFFDRLFFALGEKFSIILREAGLKSRIDDREIDQICDGMKALVTSLEQAQRKIDGPGSSGRAMKMRDVTRVPSDDDGDIKSIDQNPNRFLLGTGISLQIDAYLELTAELFKRTKKKEVFLRACLRMIKHSLESIKVKVEKSKNLSELVSSETFSEISVFSDSIKNACESIKNKVNPQATQRQSSSSGNKRAGGYGGYGGGYGY